MSDLFLLPFQRRISKDDTGDDKPYGSKNDDYDKICEKVMADNGVQKALEAMKEKWRMIMFMYDDCMDLRKAKFEHDTLAKRNKLKKEFIALLITYLLITVPGVITLYLAFLFVIWFVTTAG